MKFRLLIPVIVVLVAIIFAAGCTGSGGQTTPPQTQPPTPVQTTSVSTTALPSTTGGSMQPGPTQTIPPATPVSISVEKAGTYSTTIITHFDGGKGMSAVSKVDVRVTRPDGSVVTGVLKPLRGETVELEGTQGTDRVEVIVTMNTGSMYKIIDQQMPYKTRG
jgi:multidrug efflux pump subunit AcrA (membrane-fusion protein)